MRKHSQDQQHDEANVPVSTVRHWSVPLSMALLGALVIAGAAKSVEMSDPSRPVVVMTDQHRIEGLTEDLHDESGSRRKQVASMLGGMGEAGAEALIEAMHSDDEDVRRAAASGLVAAEEEGLEAATKALRSEDPNLAAWAAWALGEIGEQVSAEPLAEAAMHWLEQYNPNAERVTFEETWRHAYNPTERPVTYAAHSMGMIGNPESAGVLRTIAASPAKDAAEAARKALGKLREPGEPVPPKLEELQGADADTLTAALEHNDRDVRMRALTVMKEAADPSVCDAIRPLLADDDINVRAGVVAVLGACRDEESVPALIEMVETEASVSRPTGPIEALGDIGDPEAVPCLIDEMKSESPAARQQAAKALGKIGDARAVEALMAATDDQSQYIRANAIEALGLIGDPRALDAVIWRLGDEEYGPRNRAIEALGKIGGDRAIAALEQAIIDIPRQRRAIDEALDAARAKSDDNPRG